MLDYADSLIALLLLLLIPPDSALIARPIDHRRRRECGQARQPVAAVRAQGSPNAKGV